MNLGADLFCRFKHTLHLRHRRVLQKNISSCPKHAHQIGTCHDPVCRNAETDAVELMSSLDDQNRTADPLDDGSGFP